jgi:AcrR family transcriptional regulator
MWYMYPMVQSGVPTSQARERLLKAAVDHSLSDGIVDLSLREIAAAIGTSHRMLIYHFGSREGLLVAVVREVERRQREAFAYTTLSTQEARRRWSLWADPSFYGQERLFFEIYSHALLGRPGTEGFLEEVLDGWISPLVDAMTADGLGEADAMAVARLSVAVTRGLLLDLLASGDREGTTRAFALFTTLLEQWSPG